MPSAPTSIDVAGAADLSESVLHAQEFPMDKTKILWCLVGANLSLLAAVALPKMHETTAMAQIDRPADYLLIPGEVSGADRGIVYILDSTNGVLSAVTFEDSTGRIDVMPPIDLNKAFLQGGARRR
jgi:hypothetical protein